MAGLVAVALGGAAGSVCRYAVAVLLTARLGPGFPWGTLAVNLAGSFLIGLALPTLSRGSAVWALAVPGFLGGFTTFSAFEAETLALLRAGLTARAVAYVAASVALGLGACWLGLRAGGGLPR